MLIPLISAPLLLEFRWGDSEKIFFPKNKMEMSFFRQKIKKGQAARDYGRSPRAGLWGGVLFHRGSLL